MSIKKAIIRGIIPFAIMTAIALIMKYQGVDQMQVRSTFVVGIIVACVAATFGIYDIEGWSLWKQSLLHFGIMLVTVYPCLLWSGWFELKGFVDYLKVFGFFVLWGLVLWTVAYFVFGKLLSKE